jgi:hypothetical protein
MELQMKYILALLLGCLAQTPLLAASCKVIDPELQANYSGGCVDGLAEGPGKANGIASYEGHFHAGQKHGYGVKRWPNGDAYQGDFFADYLQGHGEFAWGDGPAKGIRYVGDYYQDFLEGQGELSFPWGDTYRGGFKRNQWTGEGEYRWASGPLAGHRYKGEYKDGMREGFGRYYGFAGDVYEGRWKDNKPIDPATPMMLRFYEQVAAIAKLKEGTSICKVGREGFASKPTVQRATVLGQRQGFLELKPADGNASVLSSGEGWYPCPRTN